MVIGYRSRLWKPKDEKGKKHITCGLFIDKKEYTKYYFPS